jgi:hypothetical protein
MKCEEQQHIMIIDGQGGKIGKQLVEAVKEAFPQIRLTAVGTNSIATACMVKAGAEHAATGENAVIVGCRTADIIVGPVGIVIADSLLGEVTPAMAAAVGQSRAKKILIPINKCGNIIVGVPDVSVTTMIQKTIEAIKHVIESEGTEV